MLIPRRSKVILGIIESLRYIRSSRAQCIIANGLLCWQIWLEVSLFCRQTGVVTPPPSCLNYTPDFACFCGRIFLIDPFQDVHTQ